MVRLENVTKVYGNKTIGLDHVSTNIHKGEFVFLVGASGAGKSTFLKLLFREEKPTSGKIYVGNKNISLLKTKELNMLRKNIGVVFQDFRLLEDRTAYENIAYAMEVLGYMKKDIMDRVPKILKKVGMQHRQEHYPQQLSGGEQQRIAIGRAIINSPKILLADEPSGNVDPSTAVEIMDIFKEINSVGTTIIMATHDRFIVDQLAKRVIELKKGQVVRDQEGGRYTYES
ncbi:MAG: cell division ATP-binding protein FtsE [Firmicutes bacterium]|nr:cell division ATP-binding protein FtsE [Bacillota bacterium]